MTSSASASASSSASSAPRTSASKMRASRRREADFKQREAALKAEAAAHEAAAAQLEEELEHMRAIEEQSAVEAMSLVQKTSRLQTDLTAATRAEPPSRHQDLASVQSEGERAVEDAERWRAEAERVEREHEKQTELEARYGAAMAELQALRDENGKMRADIAALHSGMEAQLRAEEAESPFANGSDAETNAARGEGETSDGEEDTFGTPAGAAAARERGEGVDASVLVSNRRRRYRPRATPPLPRGRAVRVERATPKGSSAATAETVGVADAQFVHEEDHGKRRAAAEANALGAVAPASRAHRSLREHGQRQLVASTREKL